MTKLNPSEAELVKLQEATGFKRLEVLGLVSVIDDILATRVVEAAKEADYQCRLIHGEF